MKALFPFIKLFKRQWFMMLLGLILAITTLAAGIGLLSLSGWFLSAAGVAGLTAATAQAFNFFTPAGGVRFLSIARTASRYGERLATHEATFRLLTRLRLWCWQGILPLSEKNLRGMRQGDLLNRLVADIDTLDHLYLRLITPMLASLVILLGLYGFIAWFDTDIALVLAGVLLLFWLMMPVIFYHLGKAPGMAQLEAKRQFRVQLLEYLQGFAELSLFGALDSYRNKVNQVEQSFICSQRAMARVNALSQAALVLVHGVVVTLALIMTANGVGDAVPPGPLMALIVFAALASLEMLMPIAGAFSHLSACSLAANRVNQVVNQTPDIDFDNHSELVPTDASIKLSGIDFGYYSDQSVLTELSLNIGSGEHVALLGKTGCGKSSLLALLTRQWQPRRGKILLGDCALTELSETRLRNHMSVLSQRVYLFSASLRDNLALALPQGEKVDDLVLLNTLKQVGLGALLEEEKPLDMLIGEGGRALSGGEQRRIGVARVLLRNAPVLLLDEPTEGLDKKTEGEILSLLLHFAQGKTLLMISHRLTAMEQMDCIHMMEKGKIRISGTHQTLLDKDEQYQSLHRMLN